MPRLVRLLLPATLSLLAILACGLLARARADGPLAATPERLARGSLLVTGGRTRIDVSGPLATDSEVQADSTSLFHIGSNAKAMTATLIAMYVEDGLLDWDTSVSEVWPELIPGFHADMREVTLHELLTQRSGIQAFTDGREWRRVPERSGDNRQRRIQFAQWLLEQEPAGRRGMYLYSNAGYCVASAMLEQRSGRSWEEMMQERLFAPLEMDVQFGWPLDRDGTEPAGYLRKAGLALPYGREQGYSLPLEIAPAGDLSMTLGDYAKFLSLHLRALHGEPQLLSAESFSFLHEPVGHYACGWIVLDRDSSTPGGEIKERISTHDGSAGTFYIHAEISHTRDMAAAAVVNIGGDESRRMTSETVQDLLSGL